ncbi:Membrane transporter [Sulfitobacter noctilucicola]|uniref:Putative PurR-regulated permease PerM n=1 Tax=Sulfitobacter noctilucicola TaxID=1342301 RepID=A0A7W6Q756_9RHOB|nr:AI-2E family transporter [Sulfitobacter noctilucicola]KIN64171.1 Membrane transporter [Sulfitobacter noctilucicola]MBB4175525.1 putative PurR-regulated permease PerM [Sulfitobacter noctilucicola]
MENNYSVERSLRVLVLISLFATAYFARDLILPVLLGFLMALTLSPLSRALFRIGVPHTAAAILLVSGTGLVILLIAAGSAGTIAVWSDELPRMGSEIRGKLSTMSEAVEEVRSATDEVEKLSVDPEAAPEVVVKQPGLLDSAFDTMTRIGATLAVTFILALFLLSSGDLFYRKLVQAFPTLEGKKRALQTVYSIEKQVSRYLLTITIINIALGVCLWLYLTALGMPNAYVWGVAAALLNFLPYLGGFIGTLLVGAFSIVTFDTLGYALLAPIGYQVLTTLEGQFITPWLIGRRLAMNTVAVFLTVVFWGWLWGIPGALVAVPFLVVFKVICENFEPLKTVAIFLSGDDTEEVRSNKAEPLASE